MNCNNMNRDSQFQLNSHYDVTTNRRFGPSGSQHAKKLNKMSQTTQSTIRRSSVRQEANTPRSVKKKCVPDDTVNYTTEFSPSGSQHAKKLNKMSQTTQSTIRRNAVRPEVNTPRSVKKKMCVPDDTVNYDGIQSVRKPTRHEAQ